MPEQSYIVNLTRRVVLPKTPNYIRLDDESDTAIPIGDLDDESLRSIGAKWTDELVRRAQNQREMRK